MIGKTNVRDMPAEPKVVQKAPGLDGAAEHALEINSDPRIIKLLGRMGLK